MTEKIKAIIIEDEKRAQIYLEALIKSVAPEIEIVAICDDLPSGVMSIRKMNPSIVFLDIEMPKYSGLDIVNFFREEEMNFSIIFTTAYNQYAIQAFKTSALDYLLKPIDAEELSASIKRYVRSNKNNFKQITEVNNHLKKDSKIAIPDGNSLVMIPISNIIYLKADNSYTHVILASGEKYVTSRFLKNFEESLAAYPNFYRCHKSYIINTDYILGYNKSGGGTVILKSEHEIPVSPDKVDELLSQFIRVIR